MDESEENMSSKDINNIDSPMSVKTKPKKRSLVERELETNMTARVTSPASGEGSSTSRYGRARKLKYATESDTEKIMKPLKIDVSKQPQAYKMHASNSPVSKESPKRTISLGSNIEDQIENIYNENISLSRFGSEEKMKSQSPAKKFSKIYVRKDLIQKPDTDTVVLIKNMFSPNKSSHLNNILERSSEKYSLNGRRNSFGLDNSSVVKTLDFDGKKKKPVSPVTQTKKEKVISPFALSKKDIKEKIVSPISQPSKKDIKEKVASPIPQPSKRDVKEKVVSMTPPNKKGVKEKLVSKSDLFKLEAACNYQVGDLAWARVGTYPFWPCIVTREPYSDMFVKNKLFGRVERSVIHVTFFGDNGRRGWIVDNMLRKYHGKVEFEACREKFTPESKKKDPRFYAAHFVSEKKLALWNVSVEEAETLMREPKRLRIDALYDMLEKARASKTTPSKRDKGGKITRTDSDVSLSESLYDTLFSEDDGKSDDNRSKRARNKSLDVSEVVTACLDNMAAKSGIIQIQRQSHMDRWLQKAKSKTPEKNQPKFNVKLEKRKDKAKKKKDGKKLQNMRNNDSLGSDTNLLPYQNEHDYSSVNYENHNINDSVNKNSDSTSGLDSTLDSSSTLGDIGVTVKIESLSSSMEDCTQDDIITTVVNDDIVMTDSENFTKDNSNSQTEMDNNKELENSNPVTTLADEKIEIREEFPLQTSDLTNTIEPRRSKRKRHTFEGFNDSFTDNKAKEPKLDIKTPNTSMNTTTVCKTRRSKKNRDSKKVFENVAPENNAPTFINVDKETFKNGGDTELVATNTNSKHADNMGSIIPITTALDKGSTFTNLDNEAIEKSIIKLDKAENMSCDSELAVDIEVVKTEITATDSHIPNSEKETLEGVKVKSKEMTSPNCETIPVVDIERGSFTPNSEEEETSADSKNKSSELTSVNCETPVVDIEPLSSEITATGSFTPDSKEKQISPDSKNKSTELTSLNSETTPIVVIEPLSSEITATGSFTPDSKEKEISPDSKNKSTVLTSLHCETTPMVVFEPLSSENTTTGSFTPNSEKEEISPDRKNKSTELTSLNCETTPMVVIEPLYSEITATGSCTPNSEEDTCTVSKIKSTEITSLSCKTTAVNIEPLHSKNTRTDSSTLKSEKEAFQQIKDKSKTLTSLNCEFTPVVNIEPLHSDNKAVESNAPTFLNNEEKESFHSAVQSSLVVGSEPTNVAPEVNVSIEKLNEEEFHNEKPEPIERIYLNSKSKPVVVIEPLNTEKPLKEIKSATETILGKEILKTTQTVSTEVTSVNSKSKPVVVIERLNYENTTTEYSTTPTVTNIVKETSQNKHETIELSFHKSSKPVVVIEPLDMNGLETQFIIKGSKQLVQNNMKYKKEIARRPSDVTNIFKDGNNTTETNSAVSIDAGGPSHLTGIEPKDIQGNFSKDVHQGTEKSLADPGRTDVDDCGSSFCDQKQTNTDILTFETETLPDLTKVSVEPTHPSVESHNEIPNGNKTSVTIGEETYEFDRTLSQDYDEYSHLPPVINTEKTVNAILCSNSISPEEISLQNSFEGNETSDLKSIVRIPRASNEGAVILEDIKLQGESSVFLDKESIQNEAATVTLKANNVPTVAANVSSTVNEDNNSNQVTQDNNDKCIFLDQSLKTADAQSAENIEKKRKSPRFSLNRTRNRTLKLTKIVNNIQTPNISTDKIDTGLGEYALENPPVSCTNTEMLNKDDKLLDRRDSKRSKNDPEFVQYMEIRKDALVDEQPGLTEDEIVTYLYQNWIYEESLKSEIMKIEDNEQSNLVKGVQELRQPKKIKLKRKARNAADLKNVDIRNMLLTGNINNLPRERDLQATLTNKYDNNEGSVCAIGDKKPLPQLHKDLLTVGTNKKANTELEKYFTVSATDKVMSGTRRSRRSKENTEEKLPPEVNLNTNDSEMSTDSRRLSKEEHDTKKATNEPEFLKYCEMHQDALLDDQSDLTQDEIVSYLYQKWLYEGGNKSEIQKSDGSKQNIVEDQETSPHTIHKYTLETSTTIVNTDLEKCEIESDSTGSKCSLTKINEIPGRAKLDNIPERKQKCVLPMIPPNESEMSVTKDTKHVNRKRDANQTITTEQEKCAQEITVINSKNSKTAKRTGRGKNTQVAIKRICEPEFIKYLEMHRDALLDEQPDLTEDEITTYLHKNWLYEEGNKSEIKKFDDNEQSNLVKCVNSETVLQPNKNKKRSKIDKPHEFKCLDIRNMLNKEDSKPVLDNPVLLNEERIKESIKHEILENNVTSDGMIENSTHECNNILNRANPNYIGNLKPTSVEKDNCLEANITCDQGNNSFDNIKLFKEIWKQEESSADNTLSTKYPEKFEPEPVTNSESIIESNDIEDMECGVYEPLVKEDDEGSGESTHSKIMNGFIEFEENNSKAESNEFDSETASVRLQDTGVSVARKRKEKDAKKSMDDPEFLKYLEARQDALIDEQPDLTREEIVNYLYQTWFYEESTKSDVKKSDETEQSNLVKGLNQEPLPQPKKVKKKSRIEKEPVEKLKSAEIKDIKSEKVLKNADIREMIQKPKRKATQSTPYYNEDDSDLEEEDLETFNIFDRDEQNEAGEEIDEVELYFEQLTKPKPNVFKGYVRERVCEICYRAANLVKCKSCHGTFHVDCVKREAEVTEVAGPARGRKKKRGRKPKGYEPSVETGSQSDERSQDANNSEEINISIEDEAETHLVVDEDNFEMLWDKIVKEVQTDDREEYVSDQEIIWELKPGHCEIVDLKHKEKPIDYSDYKCNKCLKYQIPVCFVCQSNKSPKTLTEIRQKCHVAHCHRYYHLECLDHWPQTQFNSWEPSKTNKKQIEYIEALTCPRHVCHTCVSDDPRGCKTRFCGDKLARCVKCPATYHSYTKCLPAGTKILTGSQIICPRHYEHRPGKVPCHVNTGWCFICALGGTLICCEYCPTSFHAECLNIKPPEGSYMCEDCETGRLPLYGEMVWVKLGHYRWWPGIVLHPTEIPENILAVKHSQGEFVVRFFGQYDHYWVNRGRVFPFQEGDSGRISSQKSKIDAAFTTAMEHAQRACEILKKMEPNQEEDLEIASSLLPPHYVKLKVNKPAGNVVRREIDANSLTQCDCDPNQPDPCGPYSHCLNRMLLTECGPLCRAGERCNNRAFERRLYPRLAAYRAPHRGWGLRTLEDIKQGQFVIEYVGELIDMEEFRRRMCRKHEIRDENFYFLTLDKERMIDAGPKGNLARFMNHCCEPNCETQKWTVLGDVRVGLFALYDIPANSEVTFNYNLECAGIEKKRCLCGAKRCSGYIGAKPKQLQEDKANKSKPPAKRTYKKRKPVEEPVKPKPPKIKIKPIKPRELTEIEKDLLIIKCATNGMSSDSEGSRLSVEEKNPKALKRKRVSFSTDEFTGKKARMAEEV